MFREIDIDFVNACPDDKTLATALQIHDEEAYNDLRPLISKVMDKVTKGCKIRGGYNIHDCIEIDPILGIVSCNGKNLEIGQRVSTYMKGATQIAFFACTAGEIFSKLTDSYFSSGDYPEAFIADAIGSVTVENAMDIIHKALETEMNSLDMNISNRYSPGYCEWPVSGQQALFSLIGENNTGIILTKSCLMLPIKSVSGIIGIGKEIKKRPYGCAICNSKACVYRKINNDTQ